MGGPSNVLRYPTNRKRAFRSHVRADRLPDNVTMICRHPDYRLSSYGAPAPPELPPRSPELALITAILGTMKTTQRREVLALIWGAWQRTNDPALGSAYAFLSQPVGAFVGLRDDTR